MARKRNQGRKTEKSRSKQSAQPKATDLTRRQILKAIPPALSVVASLSTLATKAGYLLPGTQQPITHHITLGDTLSLKDDVALVVQPAVLTLTGQEVVTREG